MDDERLNSLYRTYGPVIYARCRSLLGDPAAADDATQETFIRVYRHLERSRSVESALLWIHRIAINLCLNEIRNRSRRPGPAEIDPERLSTRGDPEERFADRDFATRLVERAHPKLRAVAWLYHVDEFDQEEVASILNVSRRTVVTRLAVFAKNARKLARRTDA